MHAVDIVIGNARVDQAFLKNASVGKGVPHNVAVSDGIHVKASTGKLVYEWDVQDSQNPMRFSKARVDIPASTIADVELKPMGPQRASLWFRVLESPEVFIGNQAWNQVQSRRTKTKWRRLRPSDGISISSSAAMPQSLVEVLERETSHRLRIQHSFEKVKKDLGIITAACSQKKRISCSLGEDGMNQQKRSCTEVVQAKIVESNGARCIAAA